MKSEMNWFKKQRDLTKKWDFEGYNYIFTTEISSTTYIFITENERFVGCHAAPDTITYLKSMSSTC